MKNFDHEVAAITGAASGMGRASLFAAPAGLRRRPRGQHLRPGRFDGHAAERPLQHAEVCGAGYTESAPLQILRAVGRNQRRVLVGRDARWADKPVRLIGACYRPRVAAARRTARPI